ncbi:unnamed protein product [Rotaria socialis]
MIQTIVFNIAHFRIFINLKLRLLTFNNVIRIIYYEIIIRIHLTLKTVLKYHLSKKTLIHEQTTKSD